MDLMYRTPSDNTIRKCIITKDAVREPESRKWSMEKAAMQQKQEEENPVRERRKAGNGLKKGLKIDETANQHSSCNRSAGTTILPEMIVHFDVSRERSIKAIEAAMLHDEKIFLVTQKDPEMESPKYQSCIRWELLPISSR